MKLIDVHCHLNHQSYEADLDQVLQRAQQAGLQAIFASGTNPAANRQILELVKKHPLIKASLGIHPIDAVGLSEGETGIPKQTGPVDLVKEFQFIKKNIDKVIAIGEVGLDYHWDKDHHQEQQEIFRKIIKFAISVKKPLICHTWDAEIDALDILEQEVHGEIPVILHCFGGRKALISRAKELGYYFTLPPSIIKNSTYKTIAQKVDLKQLLTETDAPWQSPVSSERNEPAKVRIAIDKIAEIKKLTAEQVAEQIWQNYVKIFGK